MGRNCADYDGRRFGQYGKLAIHREARRVMKWLLVAVMVAATTAGEVLQAAAMRRHGEIRDFRPGAIGRAIALLARNRFVIGSTMAMAVSFFAFVKLLSIADLSFAVPVTAITYAMET